MKAAKTVFVHASTVLSVMLIVFIIISTVNPAMSFYDHNYTRVLILALCLVTAVLGLFNGKPVQGVIALLLSIGEAALAVIGFGGGENNIFSQDAGMIVCAVFAVFSLAQGVFFTVKESLS